MWMGQVGAITSPTASARIVGWAGALPLFLGAPANRVGAEWAADGCDFTDITQLVARKLLGNRPNWAFIVELPSMY